MVGMMITLDTFKRGMINGLKTLWVLSKVLIPVYLIVTVIRMTPLIDGIAIVFKPLMVWFGLPGEAAIVLVLGNVLNLYAALGAIASLALSMKQITILAVMLAFSHSLIVETAEYVVPKSMPIQCSIIISYYINDDSGDCYKSKRCSILSLRFIVSHSF